MYEPVEMPGRVSTHAADTFVMDLDRCEHGRHRGDVCSFTSGHCLGDVSLGNPVARGYHPAQVFRHSDGKDRIFEGVIIAYSLTPGFWVLLNEPDYQGTRVRYYERDNASIQVEEHKK